MFIFCFHKNAVNLELLSARFKIWTFWVQQLKSGLHYAVAVNSLVNKYINAFTSLHIIPSFINEFLECNIARFNLTKRLLRLIEIHHMSEINTLHVIVVHSLWTIFFMYNIKAEKQKLEEKSSLWNVFFLSLMLEATIGLFTRLIHNAKFLAMIPDSICLVAWIASEMSKWNIELFLPYSIETTLKNINFEFVSLLCCAYQWNVY